MLFVAVFNLNDYKDRFLYYINVDESIMDEKCLKIILQPFIENAINHGINLLMDDGEITVSAYRKNDDIVFEIADNGVGMDENEIQNLFLENSTTAGIGIREPLIKCLVFQNQHIFLSIFSLNSHFFARNGQNTRDFQSFPYKRADLSLVITNQCTVYVLPLLSCIDCCLRTKQINGSNSF